MIWALVASHAAAIAAGAYGWYRYGPSLRAKAAKVEGDIKG